MLKTVIKTTINISPAPINDVIKASKFIPKIDGRFVKPFISWSAKILLLYVKYSTAKIIAAAIIIADDA